MSEPVRAGMAVPSELCSGFGPFSPSRRSSPPSAVAASFAPAVLQRRTTQGLINLIAVVGLYVFVGNSGVCPSATSPSWRSAPTSRRCSP